MLPLKGSMDQNQCGEMKAVYQYVSWILTYGDVQRLANSLQWATMSLKISQACSNILAHMVCTRYVCFPHRTIHCQKQMSAAPLPLRCKSS